MDVTEILDTMMGCGWIEVDGQVINESLNQVFDNWTLAVIACIQIASGD